MTKDHRRWVSLERAAQILGENPEGLRKRLARAAPKRGKDGVVEATLDGLKARKLGRTWKVLLAEGWTEGAET